MKEQLLNRINALKKEVEDLTLEYLQQLISTSWHFGRENGEYSALYQEKDISCSAFYSMDKQQFTIISYNNFSIFKTKDDEEFLQEWKKITKLANFK